MRPASRGLTQSNWCSLAGHPLQIALATPQATAAAGNDPQKAVFNWNKNHVCKVLIIDDDRPGVLRWDSEVTIFDGGASSVVLTVHRYDGNRGDVSFRVVTEPAKVAQAEPASAHKDYMPMDEVIVMRNTVRAAHGLNVMATCKCVTEFDCSSLERAGLRYDDFYTHHQQDRSKGGEGAACQVDARGG